MGKWQRRGPRPSPLAENHPQCPAWRVEAASSLRKNFSVTPQALTIKHTDFSMLSTSWRSLGPFFELCGEHGLDASLFHHSGICEHSVSHLRGVSSKQLPAESKMVLILQPVCTLSSYFSSKVDTSEHWVRPHRAWVHLITEPMFACLHIKALT